MQRINNLFETKREEILNIYFTAGYPQLEDTVPIIKALDKAGVDLVEIGIPYSDPLADGPTIQESGMQAIKNGFSIAKMFEQVKEARQHTDMPFILMGYLNPVLQYGEDKFLQQCKESGVDGLIIPDMPLHEYEEVYRAKLEQAGLGISFLISPQTPDDRIRKIDDLSEGFVYMVANSAITGAKGSISQFQIDYFERVNRMDLETPRLIGFGISNHETYSTACQYAPGVIIGSAFIRTLGNANGDLQTSIMDFVKGIRG